jgi:hypothetical protein
MDRAPRELEESLRSQVRQYDGLLDIRYYLTIGRYALIAVWPENDPRRELFRKGEVDDDCDILGWLTVDIQDADTAGIPLDQVEKQVQKILSKADNQKVPWKLRLAQIVEHNIKRKKELQKPVIDKVEQIARDLEYMVGHVKGSKMEKIMKEVPLQYQED